jgi:hypothetical protein
MPICSQWKWYMTPTGEPLYAINSVVEGSITLETPKPENGKHEYTVRIVTNELEKHHKFLECAVDDYARTVLEKEAQYQPNRRAQHYGLIIVKPGSKKLTDSTVVDFISFHRHPTDFTNEPTTSRYGLSVYNEVFNKLALEELKGLDHQTAQESASKVLKEYVGS